MVFTTSIAVLGGIVLGRNHKTSSLPCSSINSLHNVNEFLLVLESPVDLVVIPSTQIDHDVLVPEEEHDGAGVVKLIHRVEVRYLANIYEIHDSKVLDGLCDRC